MDLITFIFVDNSKLSITKDSCLKIINNEKAGFLRPYLSNIFIKEEYQKPKSNELGELLLFKDIFPFPKCDFERLLQYLNLGYIINESHNVYLESLVNICICLSVPVNNYLENIKQEKINSELKTYNPMTPYDDVENKYNWIATVTFREEYMSFINQGYSVTSKIKGENEFYLRKEKNS